MSLGLKKSWPNLSVSPMQTISLDVMQKAQSSKTRAPSAQPPAAQEPAKFTPHLKGPPELRDAHESVHLGTWQIQWEGDAALVHAGAFIASLKSQPLALEALTYTYRGSLQIKGTYYVLDLSPSLWARVHGRASGAGVDLPSTKGTAINSDANFSSTGRLP